MDDLIYENKEEEDSVKLPETINKIEIERGLHYSDREDGCITYKDISLQYEECRYGIQNIDVENKKEKERFIEKILSPLELYGPNRSDYMKINTRRVKFNVFKGCHCEAIIDGIRYFDNQNIENGKCWKYFTKFLTIIKENLK